MTEPEENADPWLGEVPVDSGALFIVDPCHLPGELVQRLTIPNEHGFTAGLLAPTVGWDGSYAVHDFKGSLRIFAVAHGWSLSADGTPVWIGDEEEKRLCEESQEPPPLGEIPADSATFLIVDPGYLPDEIVRGLITPNEAGVVCGMVVSTSVGDGFYAVYAIEEDLLIMDSEEEDWPRQPWQRGEDIWFDVHGQGL